VRAFRATRLAPPSSNALELINIHEMAVDPASSVTLVVRR
jgi:hypothetical protein